MRKLLILFIVSVMFVSLTMCINNSTSLKDMKNKIIIEYKNEPIEIPLRATIGEAKKVRLINTTDKEIYEYYHTKKLLYIRGDFNISPEEGGVSMIDLITKLKWFNQFYPHNIIIELNKEKNGTVNAKAIFYNGTEKYTYFTPEEVRYLTTNNKTMVIEIYKTNNTATIKRIGNVFIIEGNSTKELDKAESRFIIAILVGDINNVVVS